MKIFYLIPFLFLSTITYAENLLCTIEGTPKASQMKIVYLERIPESIYLKSTDENEFTKQDVNIEIVFERSDDNFESFSVSPIFDYSQINWNEEPNCYKLIGTQWYFNFYHDHNSYSVFFSPFYARESEQCIPPRTTPIMNELDCN